MKPYRFLLLAALASLLTLSCRTAPQAGAETEAPAAQAEAAGDVWGWDYEGPRGPENWGTLNPKYKTCQEGTQQSPIDLVWQRPTPGNSLKLNYQATQATIMNAGYTFRIELTPQSSLSFAGEDYLLEKIEMRTPSEHRLSGNSFPLELQFYHRSSNGLRQVVLSSFVISGKEAPWFELLWQITSTQAKFQSSESFPFDPSQMVPDRLTFYQYSGSLTHPPCLEGVQWVVMNTPLQMSSEQITRLQELFQPNNRPVQPLNNRPVRNY